jgi:hypothetical protein
MLSLLNTVKISTENEHRRLNSSPKILTLGVKSQYRNPRNMKKKRQQVSFKIHNSTIKNINDSEVDKNLKH